MRRGEGTPRPLCYAGIRGTRGNAMATRQLSTLLFALAIALGVTSAGAQDQYPSKPVRMIVSFAAGGPTDIVARIMGAAMGDILGQQFVIENRTGAGGNLGADAA